MNNEIVITNHNPQDITITQDENQLIFINGGGEVIGITDVKVNGESVVTNNIAYVIVPTKTSELQNDSHYLTQESDPTVPSYVKAISIADINNWNNKQNALVSGTNIKTINNESLLGSGNININGGESYTAGDGIDITENVISNTITSYDDLTDLPTIPTKTSDLNNDSNFVNAESLSEVAFTGSYNSLSDTPIIPDSTSELTNDSDFITSQEVSTEIQTAIATKQDTLVSGTNIKTVNNNSLLGSGDISISASATDVQVNGTSIVNNNVANIVTESAYNSSTNKIATKSDIPTNTSQLTNNSNFAVTNANNNFSTDQNINGNLTVSGLIHGATNNKSFDNIDLNNIGTNYPSGTYECLVNANAPDGSNDGRWHIFQINTPINFGTDWCYQEAIHWWNDNGNVHKYVRRKASGTWENWKQVW